ncbi:MAG: adenosylmethionine--8-amino-7-oxononanoate transaminase [Nitrospirae bacterium]|jgi:adenosylmethionine-8-amino-7-oxononanoate aminotransferase|nr:adenosylmethionine--8-amino-7-oxononanoate transaminase [Nitrospirota bacterium]
MSLLEENKKLEQLDKQYIWHPFTQMKEWVEDVPVIITEGRDCFIKDIYGKWYLDGVSSLWVNIFGHRKKELDEAIKAQVDKISHSTLLGLSNVPAIEFAEKLINLIQKLYSKEQTINNLPDNKILSKVFYSDNGSTSVEVALKMAFQYWQHKGIKEKTAFVSLKNAYHGDTIGAVSVGGIDIFHKTFEPLLFKTYKAPSPYCYRCELNLEYPLCNLSCAGKLEEIFRENASHIAAFIIEPMVQAAGGMIVSPPGYLKTVHDICKKYNVLMIADEVATGFGRTGKLFACEHEQAWPDIMCLSKGITGGYLPLAVTLATEEIYDAFLGEFKDLKTFFHGHSYTGNPIACAIAIAALNIFEKENILENVMKNTGILELWLEEISEFKHTGNVRNCGMMAGIEFVRNKKTKEPFAWEEKIGWKIAFSARDKGVFIRPLGNVIVIMPPLSISERNLGQLLKFIKESIIEVLG